MNLLDSGGLAIVGSRHVSDDLVEYTISIAQLAAQAGRMIVSGGAKGIDQAAMRGAMEAGGKVCGVLADRLEKAVMNRGHRNLLLDGRLVLISPYDPNAGFNIGNAMGRNKLIYALADASLVVNSDIDKGGTWAGAIEQLDKFKFVPVFVRTTGASSNGLTTLLKRGAFPWPNPQDVDSFEAVFNETMPTLAVSAQTGLLPLPQAMSKPSAPIEAIPMFQPEKEPSIPVGVAPYVQATTTVSEKPQTSTAVTVAPIGEANKVQKPDEVLFATVQMVIPKLLTTPRKETEVASVLKVTNAQAKVWLQRLVDSGVIEKIKKPAGYVVKQPNLCDPLLPFNNL
jgi:predicted Rossmann fold nucleotide-binding protein DprA/Smf involved in DNA uptake